MNCLSVAGGDEVCVIRAERQAVDVDEPDLGGGGGMGGKDEVTNYIWQFSPKKSLHV